MPVQFSNVGDAVTRCRYGDVNARIALFRISCEPAPSDDVLGLGLVEARRSSRRACVSLGVLLNGYRLASGNLPTIASSTCLPGPSGFSLLLILISSMPGGGAGRPPLSALPRRPAARPAGAAAASRLAAAGAGRACCAPPCCLRHQLFMAARGDHRRQSRARPTCARRCPRTRGVIPTWQSSSQREYGGFYACRHWAMAMVSARARRTPIAQCLHG